MQTVFKVPTNMEYVYQKLHDVRVMDRAIFI